MPKPTKEESFIAAAKAMENRTRRVSAYAIVDPTNPHNNGRVTLAYPSDGAGRLYVIAWLPGQHSDSDGRTTERHSGAASGYGYDKGSAAMSGARFYNLKTGNMDSLNDRGIYWYDQLRDAGYIVFHTV